MESLQNIITFFILLPSNTAGHLADGPVSGGQTGLAFATTPCWPRMSA